MSYSGLHAAQSSDNPHLGGNMIEGDPYTYAPSAWKYLISRFAIHSVLDLGSGLGYAADFFHRAGLKVLAAEGMEENCRNAVFPTFQIDLTKSPVFCRVDLVHCQEVVEHIEEDYIDNLLQSLTCGRLTVMTHAVPGQGGFHHVNLQSSEYWIDHFERRGCSFLHEDTRRVRELARLDGAQYLQMTGLVFFNQRYSATNI